MYSIAAALTQWLVFLKPQKTSSGLQRSQHKSAAAHRNRFHFMKDLTLLLRVYFEVCYLFRKRFKNRSTDQCLSWKKKNAVKGQSFIKSCIDFSFTVCSVILHLSYLVYYSQMTWTLIWSGQHWVKLHSDFFPQKPLLIASNASNVIIQSFKHASKQNLEP